MSGGAVNTPFGSLAVSTTTPGNLHPQPQPGPGCKSIIESTQASTSVAANVGPIGGSASSSSRNDKNTAACAPNYENNQINRNKYEKNTTINKNTMLMTRNSLKSISESSNQMITNSLMSSKSSATQNVTVSQKINIKIKDVAGDVVVNNIKNVATIDLTNIANISFSGFDDVKTDLADSILQQFKTNTNQESMDTMSADIQTSIANQNNAAMASTINNKVDQTKETQVPMADPTQIIPTNDQANVKINQEISNDVKLQTTLNGDYTNIIETDKTMESHIKNAVTQNFTKESLSQLAQIINQSQEIGIDIEGVGGNVTVSNLENQANIVLRQTMTSNVDFGTAIVNSVKNTMGISTDDALVSKNVVGLGLTSVDELRNGNTNKADFASSLDYKQTISQDFGMGSSGSSFSSCSICICCIICILSCGLGAGSGMLPSSSGSDSSDSLDSSDSSENTSDESNNNETSDSSNNKTSDSSNSIPEESSDGVGSSVGGYYYFD
jgi:hypothetical protein